MLEQELNIIASFLQQAIREQLVESGHNATGALIRSIENTVKKASNGWVIEGEMLIYGGAVVKGRAPKTKRIPVDALVAYLESVGFSRGAKETRGVAFHVQNRIFEEGIKPDDFIGDVFDRFEGKITRDISNAVERQMDLELTNMINNAKQFN